MGTRHSHAWEQVFNRNGWRIRLLARRACKPKPYVAPVAIEGGCRGDGGYEKAGSECIVASVGLLYPIFTTPQGIVDLLQRKPEAVDVVRSSVTELLQAI